MNALAPGGWGLVAALALGALGLGLALLAWHRGRALKHCDQKLRDLAAEVDVARRQAEASNAVKSAFLAQMSHEIRTPFQGLMGMLALLSRSGLSTRQAEQLGVAIESAEHLLAILDDILDLSQLEAGRLTLKPGPVELRPLLRQVEALMRPQAGAKALALHVDAEPSVPAWCIADATRVKQVLLNLLSNAIKFSPRGSVTLDLRLQPGPPERLVFVVTDTGVGMDPDTAAQLFQRGAAGQPASTHPDSGTGLGLDISRRLARAMGGDIDVHSVASEGSRFRFELPLLRHQPVDMPPLEAGTPSDSADVVGRSLKVLVAEDHPVNRQYLASLLETMHHEAFFVADGRAAVQAVQQQPFDLVLMDLHMPELDGTGATLAIRALPDRAAATVPIIALTADAFQETRERCLLVGMNDFLTKPVSPEVLAAALRRLYGQEAAIDGPPAGTTPLAATAPLVPPAPDTGLIDRAAIDAVLQGVSADRLSALITQFLDEGPQTLAWMRSAVRDGEPLELRAHAHAARGAALNLGLAALAQTAQLLHEGAAHLPAHEIAHLVQRYERLLDRTRSAAQAQGLITR